MKTTDNFFTARSAGILLHITSLASPHGIGTLGREAGAFLRFLQQAGQRWWQMLPLGPTGFGDSPYQSFSTFAGNPNLIDLTLLTDEGLLEAAETQLCWGSDPGKVDYARVYSGRDLLFRRAYERACESGLCSGPEYAAFCGENAAWLEDYALFMALKKHYDMRSWTEWTDETIRMHRPEAVSAYSALFKDEICYQRFLQFLFYRQYMAFRLEAKAAGIGLIGDLPIYVAQDSADVWAGRENYLLDEYGRQLWAAGVPPDYFTEDGQLWGNPIYDWKRMEQDGFSWWRRRLLAAAERFDMIRIDHFRGLESYWRVPFGAENARGGEWVKGPGTVFTDMLKEALPGRVIAEDLGCLSGEVRELVAASGCPGMKVLQFAFGSGPCNEYLPHNQVKNCVCYTGTHDNDTLFGWLQSGKSAEAGSSAADEYAFAGAYLGLNPTEGEVFGCIRGGMASVAGLFMAQMQDYLELPSTARMNFPGSTGWWRWRMLPGAASPELAARILEITRRYERT